MERVTTRKLPANAQRIDLHALEQQQQSSSKAEGKERRRRKRKPFPGKIALLKLIHNGLLSRIIVLCAGLIFIVGVARTSSGSEGPPLRVPTFSSSTQSVEAPLFPFPSLRAPARINRPDGNDLMASVGYTAKPKVFGIYFANQTSASYIGAQALPTHLQRRLTHNFVSVPIEEIRAQSRLTDSEDYDDVRRDPFERNNCIAQYDWMKQSFPTCNMLHEADLTNMHRGERKYHEEVRLLGSGYWRDVWRVKADRQLETNIVKTLRYKHAWADRNYDRHRRDALAMERLTWSPNVVDIYGFCGNSGIFEYASGGDIDQAIWYEGDSAKAVEWNSTERLVVAFQVANSLADAHNSERNGITTIAHTDITTAQFVHANGIYKLNDFNRCRFITKDRETGELCSYAVGNNPGNFRAPEEYAYKPQSEKVDIFSMGNVFYSLLTHLWPFEEEEAKEAQKLVKAGVRPPIDERITNSTDPADKALLVALHMTWKQKPEDRAAASVVRDYIGAELKRLGVLVEEEPELI
jgi:hypothetical protein